MKRRLLSWLGLVALVALQWPGVADSEPYLDPPHLDEEPAAPAPPAVPPAVAPSAPDEAPPPSSDAPPVVLVKAPPTSPREEDLSSGVRFRDGYAYYRSESGLLTLFPLVRIELDGRIYGTADPSPDLGRFRRARLGAAGWLGPRAYFNLEAELGAGTPGTANPLAAANRTTTDMFLAILPWRRDLIVVQLGQYDAPFSLENRISDRHLDFPERSLAVRALGIPENKQLGTMVQGRDWARRFGGALGLGSGDGLGTFAGHVDVMARAWIAPFAFVGPEELRAIHVGASVWTGDRDNRLPLATQTTQSGFAFMHPRWNWNFLGGDIPMGLFQDGRQNTVAGELSLPFFDKVGFRSEVIWKRQELSVVQVPRPFMPAAVSVGGAMLRGWSTYGELWWWAVGDARIAGISAGRQGAQPFLGSYPTRDVPRQGLMFAVRLEYLTETLTEDARATAAMTSIPVLGRTGVTSFGAVASYWQTRNFRATLSYTLNQFSGTSPTISGLRDTREHEVILRLGAML